MAESFLTSTKRGISSSATTKITKPQNKKEDKEVQIMEKRGSKWNIANDPNTPPETLNEFSNDQDWMIRSAVAKNRNTPPETLKKLAKDNEWIVRNNVAVNPNTPEDTLHELSDDKDTLVRTNLGKNPSAKIETVMKLAEDKIWGVRRSAIESGRI